MIYSFDVPEPIVSTSSCSKNWHLHFKSWKPCWLKFHFSDPSLQPFSYTLQKPDSNQWDISTLSTGSILNDQWIDSSLSGRPCYLFQWCTRSHNNWAARSKIKQNIYALLVEYTSHNSQIWHVVSLVYDEGDGWCLRFLVLHEDLLELINLSQCAPLPALNRLDLASRSDLQISRSSKLLISWSGLGPLVQLLLRTGPTEH